MSGGVIVCWCIATCVSSINVFTDTAVEHRGSGAQAMFASAPQWVCLRLVFWCTRAPICACVHTYVAAQGICLCYIKVFTAVCLLGCINAPEMPRPPGSPQGPSHTQTFSGQ